MAKRLLPLGVVIAIVIASPARAQDADGAAVFNRACAACHDGAAGSRAPSLESLRGRSTQAVFDALLTGAMRMQGARLTGAERRAVVAYATGKPFDAPAVDMSAGRCPSPARFDASAGPGWSGWSPSETNTHAQTAAQAGLTSAQVPHLVLKWAFGFPDSSLAFSQPSVAGGRVFVGSHSGAVYSLDAKSGCTYWTYQAKSAVRSAISIGPRADGQGSAVYFGDLSGNVYAIDAGTGALIWMRALETHPVRPDHRIADAVSRSPVCAGGVARRIHGGERGLRMLHVPRQPRGARCAHGDRRLADANDQRAVESPRHQCRRADAVWAVRCADLDRSDRRRQARTDLRVDRKPGTRVRNCRRAMRLWRSTWRPAPSAGHTR